MSNRNFTKVHIFNFCSTFFPFFDNFEIYILQKLTFFPFVRNFFIEEKKT